MLNKKQTKLLFRIIMHILYQYVFTEKTENLQLYHMLSYVYIYVMYL